MLSLVETLSHARECATSDSWVALVSLLADIACLVRAAWFVLDGLLSSDSSVFYLFWWCLPLAVDRVIDLSLDRGLVTRLPSCSWISGCSCPWYFRCLSRILLLIRLLIASFISYSPWRLRRCPLVIGLSFRRLVLILINLRRLRIFFIWATILTRLIDKALNVFHSWFGLLWPWVVLLGLGMAFIVMILSLDIYFRWGFG